jgi:hypothetical protein
MGISLVDTGEIRPELPLHIGRLVHLVKYRVKGIRRRDYRGMGEGQNADEMTGSRKEECSISCLPGHKCLP